MRVRGTAVEDVEKSGEHISIVLPHPLWKGTLRTEAITEPEIQVCFR
jgi:hypothetical protein